VIFRRWVRAGSLSLPPGEWVFGVFLLLSATANPWDALWLWPFVAVRTFATGITVLAAVSLAYVTGLNLGFASPAYFAHPWWLRPLEFGLIGLAALYDARRHRMARSFFFGGGKRSPTYYTRTANSPAESLPASAGRSLIFIASAGSLACAIFNRSRCASALPPPVSVARPS